MTANDATLLELYELKYRAYLRHVAMQRGDIKGGIKAARRAEMEFMEANAALLTAGGTPDVVEGLLRERARKSRKRPTRRGKLS